MQILSNLKLFLFGFVQSVVAHNNKQFYANFYGVNFYFSNYCEVQWKKYPPKFIDNIDVESMTKSQITFTLQ